MKIWQKDKVCNRRLSADQRRHEPIGADQRRPIFFAILIGADRRGRRRLTADRSRSAPIGGLSAVALSAPIGSDRNFHVIIIHFLLTF